MTVNSSIPLSFQAPQQMSVADLMNMRNMQLQMALQQAQLQALPQQQQMKAAMQQASLAEMQAKTRNYAAQAQDRDITMEKKREDFAKDSIAQELAAYKGAADPQTGTQRALQIRSERIDLASKNALFSPAQVQQMRNAPAQFDPAMASARLENWDTMIAQRKEAAKLAAEPPKTRERIQGTQEVQEQWDPATRSWSPIGTGPRFKPKEAAAGEGGGGESAPGGKNTELMQDSDGNRYAVNSKNGQSWIMNDKGKWDSIPFNKVPADLQKFGSQTGAGSRAEVYTTRQLVSAKEAAADLKNVVELPVAASGGWFGLGGHQTTGIMDATKTALANTMTTQEVQTYNVFATGFQRSLSTIEAAGLAQQGSLSKQMEAVIFRQGDTQLTKLQKLAQTRQIVEQGMEVVAANPRLAKGERDEAKAVIEQIKKAVPFTQLDLIKLQREQDKNPEATLKSVFPGMAKKETTSGWTPEQEKRLQELEAKHAAQ